MNIRGSGSNYQCDKSLCSLLKILIKANAWFKAQKLKDKQFAVKYAGVLEDTVKSLRIINTI